MRSRYGSTILMGLLYVQAAFAVFAVGAVVMKDHAAERADAASTVQVAALAAPTVR